MVNLKKIFSRRRTPEATPSQAPLDTLAVVSVWALPDTAVDIQKTLSQAWAAETDPIDTALKAYTSSRTRHTQPVIIYAAQASLDLTGTLWHAGTAYRLYVKGTPEQIIKHADLTESELEQLLAQYRRNQAKGYTTVAIATSDVSVQTDNLHTTIAEGPLAVSCLVAMAKTRSS